MYRKAAPRPWNAGALRAWARAVFAKRRRHVVRRYHLAWPASFVALAVAAFVCAAFLPLSMDLVCGDAKTGAATCSLERHFFGGRTTVESVTGVSSHEDAMLSDDAPKGPKLLVQTPSGPQWFVDDRTAEQKREHQPRLALTTIGPGGAPTWVVALGLGFLIGALATSLTTTLVADVTAATLRVRRWTLAGPRWTTMPLEEVASPKIRAVGGDSQFETLSFGSGDSRVSIVATDAACRSARSFLLECRREARALAEARGAT